MTRFRVGAADEIPIESMKQVDVEGTLVCVAHAEDGNFYALNDVCTHENFSLSEGDLWGLDVECPAHGSRFNLQTGQPSGPPAVIAEPTYDVTIEDGDLYIDV